MSGILGPPLKSEMDPFINSVYPLQRREASGDGPSGYGDLEYLTSKIVYLPHLD